MHADEVSLIAPDGRGDSPRGSDCARGRVRTRGRVRAGRRLESSARWRPPGGTGGESTGGGSGGAIDGMGGDGAGGTPCTPPTSGVMVDGVSRFQYGINYAWASFASDFGNTTRGVAATKAQRLTAMMDMKAHGVDAVRWWVFPNFTGGGVTFDSAGSPTGLGGSTLADITAALDDAAQADIHIQFTLFSFDNFKTATMPPHNLAPIISSPTMLSALINNVVIPFANQVNTDPNKDRVSSWDVINEPEWAIAANADRRLRCGVHPADHGHHGDLPGDEGIRAGDGRRSARRQ